MSANIYIYIYIILDQQIHMIEKIKLLQLIRLFMLLFAEGEAQKEEERAGTGIYWTKRSNGMPSAHMHRRLHRRGALWWWATKQEQGPLFQIQHLPRPAASHQALRRLWPQTNPGWLLSLQAHVATLSSSLVYLWSAWTLQGSSMQVGISHRWDLDLYIHIRVYWFDGLINLQAVQRWNAGGESQRRWREMGDAGEEGDCCQSHDFTGQETQTWTSSWVLSTSSLSPHLSAFTLFWKKISAWVCIVRVFFLSPLLWIFMACISFAF